MTEQPLVSIVIPCYNHGKYVQEAIQSVIEQDYDNIELIIIDDGSGDNSVTKIEGMIPACLQRFKRFEFRYRPNKGLSVTLNEAIEWCKGDYYSAIASDDIMLYHKTSVQVKYLNTNKDCLAVFGGADVVSAKGAVIVSRCFPDKIYKFKDIILNQYSIFTVSQMVRLANINLVGGYKAGVILEDWYMWLKLTESGAEIHNINMLLVQYRRHDNNTSNNLELMILARKEVLGFYKKHSLYKKAYQHFLYTEAIDRLPHDKLLSLHKMVKILFTSPHLCLKIRTLKYFVKVFIPKRKLISVLRGE
jgi:alpha-1,3-rhamnosyltransferase